MDTQKKAVIRCQGVQLLVCWNQEALVCLWDCKAFLAVCSRWWHSLQNSLKCTLFCLTSIAKMSPQCQNCCDISWCLMLRVHLSYTLFFTYFVCSNQAKIMLSWICITALIWIVSNFPFATSLICLLRLHFCHMSDIIYVNDRSLCCCCYMTTQVQNSHLIMAAQELLDKTNWCWCWCCCIEMLTQITIMCLQHTAKRESLSIIYILSQRLASNWHVACLCCCYTLVSKPNWESSNICVFKNLCLPCPCLVCKWVNICVNIVLHLSKAISH